MALDRIPLSEPHLGGNARRYLDECVATNFVSSVGPFVERFERELAAYVGSKHAVACSSGTAALHVALRVLGVEAGDEVWVQTLTFIASANPILYLGAIPVLVDSERRTWNADPGLMAEEIRRRVAVGARLPRVIELVHVLGQPADLGELVPLCEEHGIALLEDAAEALGATVGTNARHVGTIGRVGCFSFNGNKIITSGGGGMIVTDDDALARRAKHLTTQARLPGLAYQHDEVGYNYRLTNTAAALGVAQLERLDEFLQAKQSIAARYDSAFASVENLTPPPRVLWSHATYWLYSVLFDSTERRDAVLQSLLENGIDARPLWTPLHLMAPYRTAPRLGTGAVAETLAERGLSLPSSVGLPAEQQQRVIDVVLAGASR